MNLEIAKIRTDGGTQPRASLNFETVDDYFDAMEAGAKFPPVDVFYDGTDYWLADGFHRVRAASDTGRDHIAVTVHQGTVEDARWFSFGANKGHGLRRTNQDKQRAVQAALEHPKSAKLSDAKIAAHVGVHQTTVSDWRKRLESSQEILKIGQRTVTRNGTTYEQNISNIGRRAAIERIEARAESPAWVEMPPPTIPARAAEEVFDAECARDVLRCAKQILDCPIISDDLARQLTTDDLQVMEKVCEFIADVTAKARASAAA